MRIYKWLNNIYCFKVHTFFAIRPYVLYNFLVFFFILFQSICIIKSESLILAESIQVQPPWEVDYWRFIRQNYNSDILQQLKAIYKTSDRYFVYEYLICYDVAFSFQPWTEDAIRRVSMGLDPMTIIEIAEAARKFCPYYSQTWQPPEDYLIHPRPQAWMDYGPNLFFQRKYIAVSIVYIICWLAVICWTGYGEE